MTQPGESDRALVVAVDFWEGNADEGALSMVEVERTDPDEVSLTVIEGATLFMSKAAAREIGYQLVHAAQKATDDA